MLLALDIATVTGWAHDDPDRPGVPIAGTFRCRTPSGDRANGFGLGRSGASFEEWLLGKIDEVCPTIICFEAPIQLGHGSKGQVVKTNQQTIRLLFGLAMIVELVAERAGLECFEVNISTVKTHFAGHGRADKAAMLARCKQLGWEATKHDAADACGIWAYARAMVDPKWSPMSTPLFGRAR